MLKSEKSYTKEKKGKYNKLTDEEFARKRQESINKGLYNDKELDEYLLKSEISPPCVLKVFYNIFHIIKTKIKFYCYKNETRFLINVLLKFSFSSENRQFLYKETNLLVYFNLFISPKTAENNYNEKDLFYIERGLFKPLNEILNSSPDGIILRERDEIGKDIILDYDLMLLCSLNYFKARTKEEIENNNEDIGFSFYNARYIISLIWHCKTKQGINYFSKLVLLKYAENKEIFEIFVKTLIDFLDNISDIDIAFFDESDLKSDGEIYKNVAVDYHSECNLKTLKKILVIFLEK